MESFVAALAVKHPLILTVLVVMGFLRAMLKPTFSYLHQLAQAGKLEKFDAIISMVESSKVLKVLAYILDWAVSIKLTAPAPVIEQKPEQKAS
jgi:hypothetical protein